MSRPPTQVCGQCQTRFGSSNCVHINEDGGTTDDPYVATPIVNPSADNLVRCGPSGLGAFLPPFYLDPPAVHVYATLEQTIAFDTVQALRFNEKRYDTDSMWDRDSDDGILTFKTAGLYLITFNLRFKKTNDSAAVGDLAAFLLRNGAEYIALDSTPLPGGDSFGKFSFSTQRPFAAGDFVSALVKQDAVDGDDEPMNLPVTVGRMSPIFTATFLRPLEGMSILGMAS